MVQAIKSGPENSGTGKDEQSVLQVANDLGLYQQIKEMSQLWLKSISSYRLREFFPAGRTKTGSPELRMRPVEHGCPSHKNVPCDERQLGAKLRVQ